MRRLLASLGIILLLTVTGVTAATAAPSRSRQSATATPDRAVLPAARQQTTVVLYGDSLAWEAREHFRDALLAAGVADVRTFTFGGTAICDWLDRIRVDAAQLRPTAVVVEFSGNALTPCMTDPAGQSLAASPDAYHAKYADDARALLSILEPSGTRVYFAGAPKNRRAEDSHDAQAGWLNDIYSELAAESTDASYVDAGAAVLRRGHWTDTLPCQAGEPCTGGADTAGRPVNVVRAPDGGHFCPGAPDSNRGVTDECPVWSSGAHRYGLAMAGAVIADLAP
jgi:hypothetical protein